MPTHSRELLIATGNVHKVDEIRAILLPHLGGEALLILTPRDCGSPAEPDETANTFIENALIKAHYYARATGKLALADDSGLVVDALDGAPGVKSARYAETSEGRIARVLAEMKDVEAPARRARFVCVAALADPNGDCEIRQGTVEGWIAFEAHGTGGFGYDPIFVPAEQFAEAPEKMTAEVLASARTLAEYSAEEKNLISHRGRAMGAMTKVIVPALQVTPPIIRTA